MHRRTLLRFIPLSLTHGLLFADEPYSGPKPAKPDLPYLVHGDRLIATEVEQAEQSRSKEGDVFSVPGETSPARTPLSMPIFLLARERLKAEQLGPFRFDVAGGRRQVVLGKKHKKGNDRPLPLSIHELGDNLFRLEVSDALYPGEYYPVGYLQRRHRVVAVWLPG